MCYCCWSGNLDIQLPDHGISRITFNQTSIDVTLVFFVGRKQKKECDRLNRIKGGYRGCRKFTRLGGLPFCSPDRFLALPFATPTFYPLSNCSIN